MKKALFTLVCIAAMLAAGTGLKAREITITLNPGWNWISYPNAVAMSIATALDGFTPASGDIINSQQGSTTYTAGRWRGQLQEFTPGMGYMYYSSRTETKSFVFAQASSSVVTTAEPIVITLMSAVVGGTVTVPEGCHVFLCGVCWGTEPNPDIDGNHTSDEPGIGSFSDTLVGLTTGNIYYVRAYAVTDYGLTYGEEMSFTTDRTYVDLGLPSGTLWATCNVGADTPDGFGDYFAWGETQPKDVYNWSTYQYCNGSYTTLTKYCNYSNYGYNGYTDTLVVLLPEDDAATANWGAGWRMPTRAEWSELFNNTTSTWTTQNGVNGYLLTATNGNSIFLPATGYRDGGSLRSAGSIGYYWSSTLCAVDARAAWYYACRSYTTYEGTDDRFFGFGVRPVRSSAQNTSFIIDATANPAEGGTVTGSGTYQQSENCTLMATPNQGYTFTNWTENGEVVSNEATYTFTVNGNRNLVANFVRSYVDLGLPSGLLWATCNVGAETPEEYGDHFAWAETRPKSEYNWSTYQYNIGGLTKYTESDGLTTLLPEDDAATANWGSDWRMPTIEELEELYNNTTCTWTTQNGVNGRLFTASNGNSLFLPAAGYRDGSGLILAGSEGVYWSSSLYTFDTLSASDFYFYSGNYRLSMQSRYFGYSVRPVREN